MDPHSRQVPRAHLDIELHRLPDPAARHPWPVRGRRHRSDRHLERDPRRDPSHDRGDPRDAPAGGRLGARTQGAAAVPTGTRSAGARPEAGHGEMTAPERFTPKLIALDIDGTLLTTVPDTGYSVDVVSHVDAVAGVGNCGQQGAVDVERDQLRGEPLRRCHLAVPSLGSGSSTSRPCRYGCSALGTRTEPSSCWCVSRIATIVRGIATRVPFKVAIGPMPPSSNRPRMSRRRVWKSVQFDVEVSSRYLP